MKSADDKQVRSPIDARTAAPIGVLADALAAYRPKIQFIQSYFVTH